MDLPVIEERLKVFVSSAMGKENVSETDDDFIWLDFREKVRKELEPVDTILAT